MRSHEVWDRDRVTHYVETYGTPNKRAECIKKDETVFKNRVDAAAMREGDTVLDVGCGIGHMAALLPMHGYRGIDNSRDMIMAARRYFPTMSFTVGDVYNLSEHEMADTVYALYLLIHLPDMAEPLRQLWGRAKQALIFNLPIHSDATVSTQRIKDKTLIYHPYTWDEAMKHVSDLENVEQVTVKWRPTLEGTNAIIKVTR